MQFSKEDYAYYDCIVCMEQRNISRLERLVGGDPLGKFSRLLDFTDAPRDIADPWYTGDFETAFHEIYEGCLALYDKLQADAR